MGNTTPDKRRIRGVNINPQLCGASCVTGGFSLLTGLNAHDTLLEMSRKFAPLAPHPSNLPTVRYHALRAQAAYLRNPNRTDGPSRWEAEEAALSIEAEAEALSESVYWERADQVAREFTLLTVG